ncbi:MAG TPA: glutaminase A [Vicinamibacterales bacterium]|jgi:glutaminase
MSYLSPLAHQLHELHERLKSDARGELATYIPELANADPDLFGLCLASLDGDLHSAGDATARFTIQSVSKPFVYAIALADRGIDEVCTRVGVEPSGEPFNAISLEPETGRPANPMINAGAIVTCSLVKATDPIERFERIVEVLSQFAGRRLDLDEAVYASELETGDRNRALAYLMRNTGLLQSPVDEAIDVYFRQCALLVTAEDLAVMAVTLASGGFNPRTGTTVIDARIVEHVLTVMATCGMYDFSGEWLMRAGLPAKSGVSGGLLAVSPSFFGIGLFSPRLDARGNSIRGVDACRALADRFDIHLMRRRADHRDVVARDERAAPARFHR